MPRTESALSFRLATMADVPTLDALQKPYSRALGFFKSKYFEGYIELGAVLVAECEGRLVGYCISRDRYLKRDELGVIFQLCVAPGKQRKLVGAALVREVAARSAYGCKLYCLWCAQDLEANYFWESMGFVPIAFRTGSKSKGPKGSARVHIFWQKRIREDDTTTPWWFPSKTSGGALSEERLVLPIPPGTRWSDEMPCILPAEQEPKLHAPKSERTSNSKSKLQNGSPPAPRSCITIGALRAVLPKVAAPEPKAKKERRAKVKHDPKYVAAARELRDRYLEHVNGGQLVLESAAKYDVSRQLAAAPERGKEIPMLDAAA